MTALTFEQAAEQVKQLETKPSNAELGVLYGLYKQATEGDCTAPSPGMFSFVKKEKWKAWTSNKGLSEEDARAKYVLAVEVLMAK